MLVILKLGWIQREKNHNNLTKTDRIKFFSPSFKSIIPPSPNKVYRFQIEADANYT